MKKNILKGLLLVFVIGFLLRIWQIESNPPALNWDEVSHGYNAYSILKSGSDEWGQFFPLANFRAYGDYPLPLNLYLTIPSISIFGLNEIGIRLPHAILGSLLIVIAYYLVQGLTNNSIIGLLAALLVAIDPWTLFPSRFVAQSNLGIFFVSLGMLLLLQRNKKRMFLPLSVISFGLSVYSYHNARIFVPLFLLTIIIFFNNEWREWFKQKRKSLLLSVVLIFIFFVPLIPILLSPEGRARASWVSILDQGAINRINESRGNLKLPEPFPRLIFNKATYFVSTAVRNYFGYYDPRFLFQNGGRQYQYSIPGFGVMYPIELPFFYLGLVILIKQSFFRRDKNYLMLLIWLIFAPIPAAITSGTDHVIRASTFLPLPQILTGVGVGYFINYLRHKQKILSSVFLALFLVILGLSLFRYLSVYFGSYRTNYSWAWQYGYKEAASYVKVNYSVFNQIWVSKKYGEPHEFLYFWLRWDPVRLQNDPLLNRYFQTNWFWTDAFDKFHFFNDWDLIEKTSVQEKTVKKGETILLITSPGNYNNNWEKIKTINFLDGKPAFDILRKTI